MFTAPSVKRWTVGNSGSAAVPSTASHERPATWGVGGTRCVEPNVFSDASKRREGMRYWNRHAATQCPITQAINR